MPFSESSWKFWRTWLTAIVKIEIVDLTGYWQFQNDKTNKNKYFRDDKLLLACENVLTEYFVEQSSVLYQTTLL